MRKGNRIGTAVLLLLLAALLTATAFAATEGFAAGSNKAYFVDNANGKDTNAGTSASAPLKTLGKAYAYLRTVKGGVLVVSGKVAVANAFAPSAVDGAVLFTSVYGGVNYAETNGAKLVIGANMAFANDTYFQGIRMDITKSALCFSGRCHNLGFSGVTVTDVSGASGFSYPVLVGGWNNPGTLSGGSSSADYTLSVYSGTWGGVYGGNRRTSASNPVCSLTGDVAVDIRGGTYKGTVSGSGMNVHTGRVYLHISGGSFAEPVVAVRRLGTIGSGAEKSALTYKAQMLTEIESGTFAKDVRAAENTLGVTSQTYPPIGDSTVVVTGGTFKGKVIGTGIMGACLLKYKSSVLTDEQINGFPVVKTGTQAMSSSALETARFQNPIEKLPDPFVTEKDGIYYYCFASGTTVNGESVAAIKVVAHGTVPFGDLAGQIRTVWNSTMTDIDNAKHEYWAPEMHYLDADTVGKANAGWYIYVAADNGTNANHRMYVLRATEPENAFSDYKMMGKITDSTNRWAIDGSVMVLNKKLYFIWSGWPESYDTSQQNIYIAQMSNPWTISSARVLLSYPHYAFETKDSPRINEGPQALQYNGSTHIIYSASGSWGQNYCYGILTLTGTNPLSASDWSKASYSIFQSGNGIYGPGHGSFVQDDAGNWWMIYHANPSLTVPSGSNWWSQRKTYAKKFTFMKHTVDGKTVDWPDFGSPAADGGTQTINVRTADYHKSGDHLYLPARKTASDGTVKLTKTCAICGTVTTLHQVVPPTVKASTVADGTRLTITAASGATGYVVYRSTSAASGYAEIGTTTATTYTDKTVKVGTTYYYKVKQYKKNAYNTSGDESSYLYSGASDACEYVTKPAPLTFSATYDGAEVRLTWTAVTGAEKYRIFCREAGTTDWGDALTLTATTSYTDTGITAGKSYEYAVQAWVKNGDGYVYSPIADVVKTVKLTKLATPTLSTAPAADGIALTSSAVSGADGYKFYRSTDGKTFTQIGKTTARTYTDTTAAADVRYYYKCRAYAAGENIALYSPMAAAKTAMLEAFAESTSGTVYTAISARAGGASFKLLTRTRESAGTTVLTTAGTAAKYVYCIAGDFIVPVKSNTVEDGVRKLGVVAGTEAIVFADAPLVLYGDANRDGRLSLADVLITLRGVSDSTVTLDIAAADSNNDCKLTIADVLVTLQTILN